MKKTLLLSTLLTLLMCFGSVQAQLVVFGDAYASGMSTTQFSSTNPNFWSVTTAEKYSGTSAIQIAVAGSGGLYSGGTISANSNQNLSSYNALTFWIKSSKATATVNRIGIGNSSSGSTYLAYTDNVSISSTWQKIIIPIPDPSKVSAERGMFFISEAIDEGAYNIFIDQMQYETLSGGDALTTSVLTTASTPFNFDLAGMTASNGILTWTRGITNNSTGTPVSSTLSMSISRAWLNATYTVGSASIATLTNSTANGHLITSVAAGNATIICSLTGATGSQTYQISVASSTVVSAAATPLKPASDVLSVFSDAYSTPFSMFDWDVNTSRCVVSDVSFVGNAVKKFGYTYNTTGAVNLSGGNGSGTTISVTSVSGLSVGMMVSVTAGTGAFASLTRVLSINSSANTFTVSQAPTTALSSATIQAVPGTNYSHSQFQASTGLNASGYNFLHFDIFTVNSVNNFVVKIGDYSSATEPTVTYAVPSQGKWISYDIPFTAFTGTDFTKLKHFLITSSNGSTIYIDNIYFSKTASYYSKSSGDLNLNSNWGPNSDGTNLGGTGNNAPSNFTTDNVIYYVVNNATPTLGSDLAISGTNSKMIVGNGTNAVNFTIPSSASLTGTIDVANNATLTIQNTTIPTLGTLSTGSTVAFAGSASQTIPAKTYHHLSVNNAAGCTLGGNVTANGTLNIGDGTTAVSLTVPSNFTLTGTANVLNNAILTIQNTTIPTLGTLSTGSTVAFAGSALQTIPAKTYHHLTINNAAGCTLGGNVTANGTLNIGDGTTAASLTVPSNFTLTGTANVLNNATLTIQNTTIPTLGTLSTGSTVAFAGSALQTIPAKTYHHLRANNAAGCLLGGAVTVNGNLMVDAGSLTTGSNNLSLGVDATGDFAAGAALIVSGETTDFAGRPVTLHSSNDGTARIGEVTGTLSGATNVTAERFIPAGKRGYRFLGSIVNAGTIKNSWQEGVNNTSTSYAANQNPNNGFGTHITGSATGANGFDASVTGAASLFSFDATNGWVPVANTDATNLNAGNAYRILVRGNRAFDLNTVNAANNTATTLRATGTVVTGTVTMSSGTSSPVTMPTLASGANQFSFVANPYPSPVSWASVYAASEGITPYYYYWDPRLATRGAYIACDNLGLVSNYGNTGASLDVNLQPGQAFLIRNTGVASNRNLVFAENHKTATNSNLFKNSSSYSLIRMALYKTSNFPDSANQDGAVIALGSMFNNALYEGDAIKIANTDENIAILKSNTSLCIAKYQVPQVNDTIHLRNWNMLASDYTFLFRVTDLDPSLNVYLYDAFTNTTTLLSDSSVYGFTIDLNDAVSKNEQRFKIIFKTGSVLPMDFKYVNAVKEQQNIQVNWGTENEIIANKYSVQKSADGKNFIDVASTPAKNKSFNDYTYVDNNPFSGDNFYRIKLTDNNGQIKYSAVVKVASNKLNAAIDLVSNPVMNKQLQLRFDNVKQGEYQVMIYNISGQLMQSELYRHGGGSSMLSIKLTDQSKGIYNVVIRNSDETKNIRFIQ